MKPRRVTLSLEVETDAPLSELRKASRIHLTLTGLLHNVEVLQVQANVIRPNEGATSSKK